MSIAFILKGYPRLSETFIAQEILGLEQSGLDINIYSLRRPTDKKFHPITDEIKASVNYLPEYLFYHPWLLFRSWLKSRNMTGYAKAFAIFKADYKRDNSINRIRRFGQACILASQLPQNTRRIHFHFLHTPASVARYAAIMRNLPLSGSAHAKDIWTSPDWELKEKLNDLDWLVTCTNHGTKYLRNLCENPNKIILAYHGLDLNRFPVNDKIYSTRDGRNINAPVKILSVGRAVEKKGYDDLLLAFSNLPKDLNWQFYHIGGGELSTKIKQQAEDLEIINKITFLGAMPQTAVLDYLKKSDLFILASKIAKDGDMDGLPNVLMEAQSQGLCVLSTDVSAIAELIEHGKTGYLVPPNNHTALNKAMEMLITDSSLRQRLAIAGAKKTRLEFDAKPLLTKLAKLFNDKNH